MCTKQKHKIQYNDNGLMVDQIEYNNRLFIFKKNVRCSIQQIELDCICIELGDFTWHLFTDDIVYAKEFLCKFVNGILDNIASFEDESLSNENRLAKKRFWKIIEYIQEGY